MRSPDDLLTDYNAQLPLAVRFAKSMQLQIEQLLASHDVGLGSPVESRVKTWTSVSNKLERRRLQLSSVVELPDLIGIRIITLFKRDLDAACAAIAATFDVVSQEDTSLRLGDAQFGYHSLHYQVSAPKGWLTLPMFNGCGAFVAEVQLRTLAQHIWAVASHQLQYKVESSVPVPVRRSINRVSALLETVDLEFERVLVEREMYVAQAETTSDDALNVDNLKALMDELLPAENRGEEEGYAELLQNLQVLGVTTAGEFRGLIERHLPKAIEVDQEFVEGVREGHLVPERQERGVFFTHVGLVREALTQSLGSKWQGAYLERIAPTEHAGPTDPPATEVPRSHGARHMQPEQGRDKGARKGPGARKGTGGPKAVSPKGGRRPEAGRGPKGKPEKPEIQSE